MQDSVDEIQNRKFGFSRVNSTDDRQTTEKRIAAESTWFSSINLEKKNCKRNVKKKVKCVCVECFNYVLLSERDNLRKSLLSRRNGADLT